MRLFRIRWLFLDECGQATVEAAFMLPILLGLVLLLVQPGIILYDRTVMRSAAAEGCRVLATLPSGDSDEYCEKLIRRRLSAVPQQDNFHLHSGGCSWDIVCEGGESSTEVAVRIVNEVKPLPLIGFAGVLFGLTNARGCFEIEVTESLAAQPSWVLSEANGSGTDPSKWVGAWTKD